MFWARRNDRRRLGLCFDPFELVSGGGGDDWSAAAGVTGRAGAGGAWIA